MDRKSAIIEKMSDITSLLECIQFQSSSAIFGIVLLMHGIHRILLLILPFLLPLIFEYLMFVEIIQISNISSNERPKLYFVVFPLMYKHKCYEMHDIGIAADRQLHFDWLCKLSLLIITSKH